MSIRGNKHNTKNKLIKKSIFIQYLAVVLFFALIFTSPIALREGMHVDFVDALYLSTSAFTANGITTFDTVESFSFLGQFLLILQLQIGAFGLMSVKAFIYTVVNRKISTTDRISLSTERHQVSHATILGIVKTSFKMLLTTQLIFTLLVCIHLIIFYGYEILHALWFAYFHVTSALTNGGFDLTGNSLYDFRFDYLLQIYMMYLITVGGLGFPILVDLYDYVKAKRRKRVHILSLFTKISLSTTLIVTIVGVILLSITERNTLYATYGTIPAFFFVLFQAISSRSAGLTTMYINSFTSPGQLVLTLLMFIGGAPASPAGGLRTTTIAILFLFFKSYTRSKNDIVVFNRTIPRDTVFNAFMSVTAATMFIVVATFFIFSLHPQFTMNQILFEVTSSFGTTGMTLGISANLDYFGKFVMCMVMIVGQVGITTMMLILFDDKTEENLIKYPEENVPIG